MELISPGMVGGTDKRMARTALQFYNTCESFNHAIQSAPYSQSHMNTGIGHEAGTSQERQRGTGGSTNTAEDMG